MGLIIFLVLDFVALMLVKNKHIVAILALLLLGGLVGAVYDFTPIVISACWDFFQMITSVIPIEYLIGIIVAIIAIKGFSIAIRRSKGKKLMKWLDRVGVGKVDPSAGNRKTLKYLVKKNQVKVFSGNYVVSIDFGRAVQIENYNRRFISKADMLGICMQVLPTFDTCCFDAFFGFFQENLLIPFPMGSEQDCYVSIDFIIRCGHEFETMGAATHDELASLLEQSQSCCDCRLNGYYDSLARIVLDRMVTKGDVNATPLGGGVMLYVSKHPREGAKLVRREISLD